jgi:methylated-DNA-[protein]-cysteine S-methyltransferase
MTTLLSGERIDLTWVELDLTGVPDYHRRVYDVTRTIPAGSTMTYGEVARRIDPQAPPGTAQAVGQALGRNPCPIVVPCHRVLAAGGHLGGFSADGGADTKRRMLLIEGAPGVAPTLF